MTFVFVGLPNERMGMVRRWTRALPRRAIVVAAVSAATPLSAAAQPAATARPQGGQVVAGAAQISGTDALTRVTQSSQRAAIDWRSFDVGSGQQVDFQQPSASAVTLNRVNSADPSQIAGKITATGQVVLINQSGVLFTKGAQVDAQSVIVSAAGITNQNFMAGRMVFDQPARPDAQIANAGRITVKQAGLAALVAPRVRNAGLISARLGHVILDGSETHTLDLYGDGLLSFDVTRQVRQAPADKDGKAPTALVTNTGTIRAEGGTVLLTASAVDGVVQNLVTAGGRMSASRVGEKTGTIVLSGTGGSLTFAGTLAARGQTGPTGGPIRVASTGDATLAGTARVNASGRDGNVETTVFADATERGRSSEVPTLSARTAQYSGAITAPGGSKRDPVAHRGDLGSKLPSVGFNTQPPRDTELARKVSRSEIYNFGSISKLAISPKNNLTVTPHVTSTVASSTTTNGGTVGTGAGDTVAGSIVASNSAVPSSGASGSGQSVTTNGGTVTSGLNAAPTGGTLAAFNGASGSGQSVTTNGGTVTGGLNQTPAGPSADVPLSAADVALSISAQNLPEAYGALANTSALSPLSPLLLVSVPQFPVPLGWISSPDVVPPNIAGPDY
jgi:filamentous hemagglutinin family protein